MKKCHLSFSSLGIFVLQEWNIWLKKRYFHKFLSFKIIPFGNKIENRDADTIMEHLGLLTANNKLINDRRSNYLHQWYSLFESYWSRIQFKNPNRMMVHILTSIFTRIPYLCGFMSESDQLSLIACHFYHVFSSKTILETIWLLFWEWCYT